MVLVDKALHCVSGLPLTEDRSDQSKYGKVKTRKTPYLDTFCTVDNYEIALDLLKYQYRNNQVTISSQMNALVKFPKARNDDIHDLKRFYDDIESNSPSSLSQSVITWNRSKHPWHINVPNTT